MKTNYIAVAMRCTQEQFDSIKDRIPLPIIDIFRFDYNNYLVNNYEGDKEVSNIDGEKAKNFNRVVYETFDGELFLDCCGRDKDSGITQEQKDAIIEEYLKDKGFKGNELEWRSRWTNRSNSTAWESCYDITEYRLKPQPDYSKEIGALENKAKENGQKVIIKIDSG